MTPTQLMTLARLQEELDLTDRVIGSLASSGNPFVAVPVEGSDRPVLAERNRLILAIEERRNAIRAVLVGAGIAQDESATAAEVVVPGLEASEGAE